MLEKKEKRHRRHKRVRAKIFGTVKVPRLCVFRSNRYIYAQIINDEKGETLAAASDEKMKKVKSLAKEPAETAKVALAHKVGKLIAEKALKNKIENVIFDRGGWKYHGRIKAVADGAREGGLKF